MKTIIAGSRNVEGSIDLVMAAVRNSGFSITEVVSGTARGIDAAGEAWGRFHDVPIVRFPANWDKHGKAAGFLRNRQMAEYAEALIAVWDGESKGTKHMIDIATKLGLKVYVHLTRGQDTAS